MKNVLYVGPYRQDDGWGNAAKEYVRALSLVDDISLVCRPIYLNGQNVHMPLEEFEQYERTDINQFDVIIQHALPEMFRYFGGAKNIGLCFFETYDINSTPWAKCINILDEMWVSSEFEKAALERSSIKVPVEVVRIGHDPEKYKKSYPRISSLEDGKFNFYFIGEYTDRKDINSLLVAYFRAFSRRDNVRLVLKVHKTDKDVEQTRAEVTKNIQVLKESLGIHKNIEQYPEIAIIATYLTEAGLYGLHQSCDCFVTASYGEAFCIPAFDATMFGNHAMVNANSSMVEYEPSHSINSYLIPAIASSRPLPYLQNGKDCWFAVDILDLQDTMERVYTYHVGKRDAVSRPEYERATIAQVMQERIHAE